MYWLPFQPTTNTDVMQVLAPHWLPVNAASALPSSL